MKQVKILHARYLVFTLMLFAAAATAGPSGGGRGGSGGGGGGFSGRSGGYSSAGRSSSYTSSRPPQSAAASSWSKGGTSSAARGPAPQPRSLLQGRPPISPSLAQTIREKEKSSGPGWLGTAFLIALLSQHDLSSSDKSWIQGQIDNAAARDQDDVPLIEPARPATLLAYTGLLPQYPAGVAVRIEVTAKRQGTPLQAVQCQLDGVQGVPQGAGTAIEWKARPGAYLLECVAGTRKDRRLIRVAEKS